MLHQILKVVDNILIFNAVQKASSCTESTNSHFDIIILQCFFKNLKEALLIFLKLILLQMAICQDLKNIHCKLLRYGVLRL